MQVKSLISEDGKRMSLGRLSFWIVFFVLVFFWILSAIKAKNGMKMINAPETLHYAFLYLLSYNIGKKFVYHRNKKKEKQWSVTHD